MDLQHFRFASSLGPVVLRAHRPAPRVVAIHGFARSTEALEPLADIVPDLGFLLLPGHNDAPAFANAASVEAWTVGFAEFLSTYAEPPLLIGESVGAVIAMSVPSRAVVAVEPLLSVENLWPFHIAVQKARARGVPISPEFDTLFVSPFHAVLDQIRSPTLVIAAGDPLLPQRETRRTPSVLDDDDFAAYARHPLVEARRIEGGHALMSHNRQGVLDAAAPFMSRHGYFGDRS
jgi:hypothetical protein